MSNQNLIDLVNIIIADKQSQIASNQSSIDIFNQSILDAQSQITNSQAQIVSLGNDIDNLNQIITILQQ